MDPSSNHPSTSASSNNGTSNDNNATQPSVPKLCLNQCGFFGTAEKEWLCSACYKKVNADKQQPTSSASASLAVTDNNASTCNASTSTALPTSSATDDTIPKLNSFKDLATVMHALQKQQIEHSAADTDTATAATASTSTSTSTPASTPSTADVDVDSVTSTPSKAVAQSSSSTGATITPPPSATSLSTKKASYRCFECRKKLTPTTYHSCRCTIDPQTGNELAERVFCSNHRHTWTHQCTVDTRKIQAAVLKNANPEIKSNSGLERI